MGLVRRPAASIWWSRSDLIAEQASVCCQRIPEIDAVEDVIQNPNSDAAAGAINQDRCDRGRGPVAQQLRRAATAMQSMPFIYSQLTDTLRPLNT